MAEHPFRDQQTGTARVGCVITAAGRGERMGGPVRKQFLTLRDRPLLAWTLQLFNFLPEISEIALVVPTDWVERVQVEIVSEFALRKIRHIVSGGSERQESVYRGLSALDSATEIVLIHDGVRPFVRRELIDRLLAASRAAEAVVPGFPLRDTVKSVAENRVTATLPRDHLWAVQTPQLFRYPTILRAHRQALRDHFIGTDDAGLVERLGVPVATVPGDPYNIKITTPEDLAVAEKLLPLYYPER